MRKIILIIVGITIVSLSFFFACAAPPSEAVVKVTCDEFNKQAYINRGVEIALGGILIVQVCSDPTKSFEWLWHITGTPIIGEVDIGSETPEGATGIDTAEYVRTFKAGAKGKTNLVLEQVRPGVPEEKGPWKLNLKVTVK
jgi:hypothetical protein